MSIEEKFRNVKAITNKTNASVFLTGQFALNKNEDLMLNEWKRNQHCYQ